MILLCLHQTTAAMGRCGFSSAQRDALFQLLRENKAANAEADPTQVECAQLLAAQQSMRA
jgi:hypothetical protein